MLNYWLFQKFKQLEYGKFNHLTTAVWLVYQRVKLHLENGISLKSEIWSYIPGRGKKKSY